MLPEPGRTLARMLKVVLAAGFLVGQATVAVCPAAPEPPAEDPDTSGAHVTIAGRQVAVWKPAGPAPADGYPLIVFSHGFDLCETHSKFLTEGLAQAGYLVLAPHHQDGACRSLGRGLLVEKLTKRPEEPFRNPEAWSDATHRDRRDDVEAVLDAVLKEPSFEGVPVDRGRIGLAGHSLGGYTVLGLAGAWPSWKDPRVKAVLALAPYCEPFFKAGDLGHLNVPVMFQAASGDLAITPTVVREGGGYDRTSAPKSLVEFSLAGHLAWTSANGLRHGVMAQYARAFFDRHLKGVTGPDPLAELFQGPRPSSVKRAEASP